MSWKKNMVDNFAWNGKCHDIYIIFIFSILFMFGYWLILKAKGDVSSSDALNKIVIKDTPLGDLSWWPILHFILFAVIGFLYPCCDVMALTFGVLWEIWENLFGKYVLKEKKFDNSTSKSDIQYITWWQGSTNDVVMNFAGFYVGKTVRIFYDSGKRLS